VAGLALVVGANTTIFSVVNSVLLKQVPLPDPDQVVMFMTTWPGGSSPWGFAGAEPAASIRSMRCARSGPPSQILS